MILMGCFANYEKNGYHNMHMKFQVHYTNIFRPEAKTNTSKDDPTISCSHSVAETSVLLARKKNPLDSARTILPVEFGQVALP